MTIQPLVPGRPGVESTRELASAIAPPAGVESLVDLLQFRARVQPDRVGFTFLGAEDASPQHLTYSLLDRQARAIGEHLRTVAAPGDRALILLPHGPAYVAAFFGCLYAGVVAVPAFPPSRRRLDERIAAIAEDADASVVLATQETIDALTTRGEQYPSLRGRCWVAVESLLDADETTWQPDSSSRQSRLAYLQYTSGSTSAPRGVMIGHANILHNLEAIRQGAAGRPLSHVVSWVPLFHDLGLVAGTLMPIYLGITVSTISPVRFLEEPMRWLRLISSLHASASPAPSFAYDLCVERSTPAERAALDLSSWTLACLGAEPIRPATIDRFTAAFAEAGFRREAFWPAFGLAESTLAATTGIRPGQPLTRTFGRAALERGEAIPMPPGALGTETHRLATSGRWANDSDVVIVDPARRVRLPDGAMGEIWTRSGSVGLGYWNRPEDSAATFQARLTDATDVDSGPYLRTGDLGFVHDDELFVTGRIKDLIVIRGRNHYPHDLEHTAQASHPALRPAGIAAIAVERDGTEAAVVVAEVRRRAWPDRGPLEEIANTIRIALAADHQIEPAAITLIGPAVLPKTSSGKLRRGLIRETWLVGGFEALYTWESPRECARSAAPDSTPDADAGPARIPPTSPVSEPEAGDGPARILPILLDCVGQALGAGPAGISADHRILGLGLDSLRLVRLKLTVEQRLGRTVPFEHLEENPSLRELAARLAAPASERADPGQAVDLWAEARLDAAIRPPQPAPPAATVLRDILLTGATGFLGAYLLRELLDQTDARVHCLVRAPDEAVAHHRLRQALMRYGLGEVRNTLRIRVVPGDLGQPLLGLGADCFAALTHEIDTIVHNGAWLNFVHAYERLKPANVDGTRELLRLACLGRQTTVHYVSTAGVFYAPAYDGHTIDEATPPDQSDGLDLGYVQSKWVAEQLVWQAAQRGLAASVYRPGWIFGDSRTGRANADDFFGRLIQGCIQLGVAPRVEYRWRGAPVEHVARSIVALATGTEANGRAFHLSGSSGVRWEDLVAWIAEAGYPVQLVEYDAWLSQLSESEGNTLFPLLPFFAERTTDRRTSRAERYLARDLAHLDSTATRAALPASVPGAPPLGRDLLHRYLVGYAASGLLPPARSD